MEFKVVNRTRNLGAVLILLIICFFLFAGVARADVAVGVEPGDWAKYNITGPSDVPGQLENYWLNATVTDVTGTVVSIDIESNSTSVGNQSSIQVDIAYDCWIDGAWPLIVPANLSAGDNIPGGPIATINDTTQHFGRDAAHIATNSVELTSDWYWDRQKGVLLEASGNTSSGPIAYALDSTNMWGGASSLPGLDPWVWAVIVIVIVVAAAVGTTALVRHKRKPSTTAPTPPTQYPPPPPPPPPP